jgi:hypothetical protein
MSNREWNRTDYIEEDVRRHSEEIRAITKIATENTVAIREMIKEIDRRQALLDDHELRLRTLETWKSRSMVYWSGVVAVIVFLATTAIPALLPFASKAIEFNQSPNGLTIQTPN